MTSRNSWSRVRKRQLIFLAAEPETRNHLQPTSDICITNWDCWNWECDIKLGEDNSWLYLDLTLTTSAPFEISVRPLALVCAHVQHQVIHPCIRYQTGAYNSLRWRLFLRVWLHVDADAIDDTAQEAQQRCWHQKDQPALWSRYVTNLLHAMRWHNGTVLATQGGDWQLLKRYLEWKCLMQSICYLASEW